MWKEIQNRERKWSNLAGLLVIVKPFFVIHHIDRTVAAYGSSLTAPLQAVDPHILTQDDATLRALHLVLGVVIVIPIHPKEERGERLRRERREARKRSRSKHDLYESPDWMNLNNLYTINTNV